LNLAGASTEDLSRGMMLTTPAAVHAATRIDVSLAMLRGAKPLKDRARVHLHVHAAETIATVALYGKKQAAAGEVSLAQLRLADPLAVLPGDRFIVRQFSPLATIGGGLVLDTAPLPKSLRVRQEQFLNSVGSATPAQILEARVSRRGDQGLTLAQAVAETGWQRRVIESYVKSNAGIIRAADGLIEAATFTAVTHRITEKLAQFHAQNPLVPGISSEELHASSGASDWVFNFVLNSMLQDQNKEKDKQRNNDKKVEVTGGFIRLAGRGVVMKYDEAESRKIIEHAFASAGLKVPALKDVLAGLKIDRARAQKIVTLLLRDKTLIKVSDDLVFHQSALADLRKSLAARKLHSPRIDVAAFKDLTGVSRKYAIPLLEYLDRERVTRRIGDERIIL
ncbi:MAG: SelB C-terminal domain-containing protein, partial [Acidobacteriales bacterium]|nr:SelB C-terminal domain-containing protein [Terriglobales bacterium]